MYGKGVGGGEKGNEQVIMIEQKPGQLAKVRWPMMTS